jgi:hypothetical protein
LTDTARRPRPAGLLAAVVVRLLLVLAASLVGAGPASAGDAVGASLFAARASVGPSASISPGQRLGNDPVPPEIVVATGVAAETADDVARLADDAVLVRGGTSDVPPGTSTKITIA